MFVFSKSGAVDLQGNEICCTCEAMKARLKELQEQLENDHVKRKSYYAIMKEFGREVEVIIAIIEPEQQDLAEQYLKEMADELVAFPLQPIVNVDNFTRLVTDFIASIECREGRRYMEDPFALRNNGKETVIHEIVYDNTCTVEGTIGNGDIGQFGATRIAPATVLLAEDAQENTQLILQMLFDKKGGGRKYRIIERVNNIEYGIYSSNAYFTPWEIANVTSKIEVFIYNMRGNYRDKINNILAALKMIEEDRVLKISERNTLNSEVYTTEQIIERIKGILLANPLDNRFDVFNINDEMNIGIVGRDKRSAYKNFADIVMEVAPENNVKSFKDECFRKNLFQTDDNKICKDCQKTIPKNQCIQRGIRGDKMYNFKFEKEFVAEYLKARNDALSKKEEEQVSS